MVERALVGPEVSARPRVKASHWTLCPLATGVKGGLDQPRQRSRSSVTTKGPDAARLKLSSELADGAEVERERRTRLTIGAFSAAFAVIATIGIAGFRATEPATTAVASEPHVQLTPTPPSTPEPEPPPAQSAVQEDDPVRLATWKQVASAVGVEPSQVTNAAIWELIGSACAVASSSDDAAGYDDGLRATYGGTELADTIPFVEYEVLAAVSLDASCPDEARRIGLFAGSPQDVATWQEFLATQGYRIDADGVYGEETADATRDFQASVGLVATGELTPATIAVLRRAGPSATEDQATPTPLPTEAPTATPTPRPTPTPEPTPTSTPVPPRECHPSYSGCLTPGIGDYDCAGGSGNGPNYTGRVEVWGWDEFDLDRDNDGVGCE